MKFEETKQVLLSYKKVDIENMDEDGVKSFRIINSERYPSNMTIRAVPGWKYYEPIFELTWIDERFDIGSIETTYDILISIKDRKYSFPNMNFDFDIGLCWYRPRRVFLYLYDEEFENNKEKIFDLIDYLDQNKDNITEDIKIEIKENESSYNNRLTEFINLKEKKEKIDKEWKDRELYNLIFNSGKLIMKNNDKPIHNLQYNYLQAINDDNESIEIDIKSDDIGNFIYTVTVYPKLNLDKSKKYTLRHYSRRGLKLMSKSFKYKELPNGCGQFYVECDNKERKRRFQNLKRILKRTYERFCKENTSVEFHKQLGFIVYSNKKK